MKRPLLSSILFLPPRPLLGRALWGLAGVGFFYLFWLMLKITAEYLPPRPEVGFLNIKQTEIAAHAAYLPIFYVHVYTGLPVLLSGFLALARPRVFGQNFHRWVGKIYVVLLLGLCAPAGLYMGFLANGGVASQTSFVLLGVLWWGFTWRAFVLAKRGKFARHRQWMWRSYALAASALTLRLWKVALAQTLDLGPMEVYQIVAWLGWVPNWFLVEILIQTKKI